MMVAGEFKPLVEYERLGAQALLSIPTPDHYFPLLYGLGTSVSMLSVRLGSADRDRLIESGEIHVTG